MKRNVILFLLALAANGLATGVDETFDFVLEMNSRASFNWIQQNILVPSCIRCHKGSSPAGEVDLTSYRALMESGVVVVGNPIRSTLYTEIESGGMPKKRPKLSDEKIQAVREWIELGAPQN